jgi:hypothetical protein
MERQFFVEAKTFLLSVKVSLCSKWRRGGNTSQGLCFWVRSALLGLSQACSGEGGFVVSRGRGFCQILSGIFKGLDRPERL